MSRKKSPRKQVLYDARLKELRSQLAAHIDMKEAMEAGQIVVDDRGSYWAADAFPGVTLEP